MKKVTFGMFYEMYGQVTVEVPDDVTEDNVVEHLLKNFDKYPLPSGGDYVSDSAELDTEYINFEEDSNCDDPGYFKCPACGERCALEDDEYYYCSSCKSYFDENGEEVYVGYWR